MGSSLDIVKTGRTRQGKRRVRRGSCVQSALFAEVRHGRCGYVWWTSHPSVTGNRPINLGPGA